MDTLEKPRRWRYRSVEEVRSAPGLGRYLTYGIQAEEGRGGAWTGCGMMHDAAVSRQSAERMAALFTRCQLSPLHLGDAVADLLDSSVPTGEESW